MPLCNFIITSLNLQPVSIVDWCMVSLMMINEYLQIVGEVMFHL
jgi:hypothetical protein